MKKIIPLLIIVSFLYVVFYTSCANQGMPTGGPKDTIPPVVVKTYPALRATGFKGKEIDITFDEYIVSDEISEKLVISPPMKKKPEIRMKSKTLMIQFPEGLKDTTTYSLDFKNSVADNNEKNKLKNLRFLFSTGPRLDTLRVAGYVRNALSLEPVEGALVALYRDMDEQAFYDSIPDYISKTDDKGFFLMDNIAAGRYRLYALSDADNSLTYNQAAEKIAFADSVIVPAAKFVEKQDTITRGQDTLAVSGEVQFFPGLQFLRMFEEENYSQFLNSSIRDLENRISLNFAESLTDSFKIGILDHPELSDKLFLESNLKRDTIAVWLTDTLLSRKDTLLFQVKYEELDSLNKMYVRTDTLEMIFKRPKKVVSKRRKKEEVEIPQVTLQSNLQSSGFDLYRNIVLESPEPLQSFDTTMVHLYFHEDTIKTLVHPEILPDPASIRKYLIKYHWESFSNYTLEVDSAAARNIYGDPSRPFSQKFQTQKENYYGQIILNIENLNEPAIVQLLKNDKDETILQKAQILESGKIEFPYLKPDKYKIRLIFDDNQNGIWDTGYLKNKKQPEQVIYYPKIIKVRSHFEFNETWKLDMDALFKKDLVDDDLEKEKARKKQAELKNGKKPTDEPETKPREQRDF
jgi:hypothetical protein